MKKIALVTGWFGRSQFNEYKTSFVQEDNFLLQLYNKLSEQNLVITNRDLLYAKKDEIDIEIHFNVQLPITRGYKICLLLEDYSIRPQNILYRAIKYNKVFTWDKNISKYKNVQWVPYPHDYREGPIGDVSARPFDFVLMASNRNTLFNNHRSLYNKRQEVISFFEANSNYNFDLYGPNWDIKFAKSGFLGRFIFEFSKKIGLKKNVLSNWRGYAKDKCDILAKYKFAFCYENMLGIEGYVSEKIYDCFQAGCIPIYYKPYTRFSNYIPDNLYINPSDFNSFDELVSFCLNMSPYTYECFQNRIHTFSQSNKNKCSVDSYIKSIMAVINEIK